MKPFRFIKIIEAECVSENAELDDYGHSIVKDDAFMKGCFLRKVQIQNGQLFKIPRKVTFFHKENVLYTFVNFIESNKGLIQSNTEYNNIHYVENNNFVICKHI